MRELRVGIDARLAGYRRGMGNVVYNYLLQLAQITPDICFTLYLDDARTEVPEGPGLRKRVIGPGFYPLWEQVVLPRKALEDRLDILHSPANTGPVGLSNKIKMVLTIHDVMYLLPPTELPRPSKLYQRLGRAYRAKIVPGAARRADRVVTMSEYSKQDINRRLGLENKKVDVVYLASGLTLPRPTSSAPGRYLFALGATDPRKNTPRLIEAFSLINPASYAGELRIAGLSTEDVRTFSEVARQYGVADRVRFYGFVSEPELAGLYAGADVFVYPSLYEGFGLPVLEAMQYGAPVVCSDTTSLPEVAGDAALLVNPRSAQEIASAIQQVLNRPELRRDLVVRGLARARAFSWRRMAEQYLQVYQEVVQ